MVKRRRIPAATSTPTKAQEVHTLTTTTVTAQDSAGKSYTVTVSVEPVVVAPPPPVEPPPPPPAPTSSIPLSWNAAQFASNTSASSTNISNGGTLANKSITDTGSTASIVTGNGATITNCRVNSREAVRIGGGGSFLIDGCYIETTGTGADHADGIQAYSPGSRGVLKITNTTIKSHTSAATAGLFIADNWTGTIDLENVVVWGGPYGVRIHPDTGGDNIVRLKNVFVVGPFGYDGLWIDERVLGGHKNIIQLWDNVREATIDVNGQLVPGNLIPKPF